MNRKEPSEKRKIIPSKWNAEERYYLQMCAARRSMNVSKYLRWLMDEDKKKLKIVLDTNG